MTTYLDLFHYRELFGSLFRRLRAKYKGSVLGLAWSLAHPVILLLVYLLVFSVMLKVRPPSTSIMALPAGRPASGSSWSSLQSQLATGRTQT
jgi:ABC-type polysaccharide/polyol phosphate export permease